MDLNDYQYATSLISAWFHSNRPGSHLASRFCVKKNQLIPWPVCGRGFKNRGLNPFFLPYEKAPYSRTQSQIGTN